MSIMTVPTSYNFTPNIDPLLTGDQGHSPYNPCAQWQYDPTGTEQPRLRTGSNAFGSYVSPKTPTVVVLLTHCSHPTHWK